MQTLERLLRTYAEQTQARWWVGGRPKVREARIATAIAARVSYPTSETDPLNTNGMVRLNRAQAAHVLAVAGTTSLAYDQPSPAPQRIEEAMHALDDLARDATFLSNGLWNVLSPLGWNPLTSATFDCGVIGYDAANAFIFWVEEED